MGDMKAWLDGITGGTSVTAAAKAIGVTQSTLDGQIRSAKGIKPHTAVDIARAYGADPVVALVGIGLLRPDEVTGVSAAELRDQIAADMASERLESMEESELTAEIRRLLGEVDRRIAEREKRGVAPVAPVDLLPGEERSLARPEPGQQTAG